VIVDSDTFELGRRLVREKVATMRTTPTTTRSAITTYVSHGSNIEPPAADLDFTR
jgi:hypothetical protein